MTILNSLPDVDGFAIALLGGFCLCYRSVILSVPRASQRLLALLALRGGPISRATIAGTLWPDSGQGHAYSNLRSALSRLEQTARKALMASQLDLGLAEHVAVDVRQAGALARRLLDPAATLDHADIGMAAVAALSVDLLPDWDDDWVVIEAEDWRQLRLYALEALASRLTAQCRYGEAASAARAAVRAEPLRESAHAALMQVYLAEGNQSEALRQFARYRTLLNAELGLEPTSRLLRLIQNLQRP